MDDTLPENFEQEFPEFEEASAIECILEEGDVVYIPSKWPHYVECLSPSVSLTCNFANVANFKHVLVPYTRWLERRRMTLALVKKMKEAVVAQAAAASSGAAGSATAPALDQAAAASHGDADDSRNLRAASGEDPEGESDKEDEDESQEAAEKVGVSGGGDK